VAAWRSMQASREEPAPSVTAPETGSKTSDDDPDLASGRM
jgi:hypothetical protein